MTATHFTNPLAARGRVETMGEMLRPRILEVINRAIPEAVLSKITIAKDFVTVEGVTSALDNKRNSFAYEGRDTAVAVINLCTPGIFAVGMSEIPDFAANMSAEAQTRTFEQI